MILTVLWSIGASFVVLAGLIFLPSRGVGALGVLLIATHGLAGGLSPGSGAPVALRVAGVLLLRPGFLPLSGGVNVVIGYPLIPWLGVVAAGYGFGEVIRLEPGRRLRVMFITGVTMTTVFVILRAWGIYGEPRPWTAQATPLLTGLSLLNRTKQPPSLLFVLMSLGPAIAALAVIDRLGIPGPVGRVLVTLGRVPLFRFHVHFYVIHGLAVLLGLVRGMPVAWLFSPAALGQPPVGWSLSLPGVYAAWAWCWPSSMCLAAGSPGSRLAIPEAGCPIFDHTYQIPCLPVFLLSVILDLMRTRPRQKTQRFA